MTITFSKTVSDESFYYYSLSDQQELLFPGYELTAVWGRDLNRGRVRHYRFATRREMREKLQRLIARRLSDGYRIIYTFPRSLQQDILHSHIHHATS